MIKQSNIMLILGFVIAFSLTSHSQETKELKLSDVWASAKFLPDRVQSMNPMKDGDHYCVLENGKINRYAYAEKTEPVVLLDQEDLEEHNEGKALKIDDYSFNADESKILIETEKESIYRYSSKAYFYIWDREEETLTPLSDHSKGKQRLAEFSPDGNHLAFVRNNNVYIVNWENGEEIAVTTDGEKNKIINGTCDWVYEEEFKFTKGFHWSEEGNYLAYYRFDESDVKEFQMILYEDDLYPRQHTFKYPKAGEDNSIVSIHVFDLKNRSSKTMDTGSETDQYIPRIKWTKTDPLLAIQRLNRLQNNLDILYADARKGSSRVVYNETNPYYIDIDDHWTFLQDNSFIFTSEKDGYNHLYHIDEEGSEKQLTNGEWVITDVKGINRQTGWIYYISTQTSPMERNLYKIRLNGKDKKRITKKNGTHSVDFSGDFSYFLDSWSSSKQPPVYAIYKENGKQVEVFHDNKSIVERMEEYGFSGMEFIDVPTEDDIILNGFIIKPPDFEENKQYPLLMHVYGGPGSQEVSNSWGGHNYIWFEYMAQQGYIIACVDNRGTGYRGQEFKKSTYLELGKLEIIDQINAAKHFGAKPYIDSSRIGIFGWSYGGYMSLLAMTKGADYFSSGVSVAPVTNWRFYDNIYTERFMRTPQENGENYDSNSPLSHVAKLKDDLFIIHGNADDNVHPQNTMMMVKKMVRQNIDFEMMLYPNKNHGIYGGYTRLHLFNKISEFIKETL
ncbi:MAG: S9 family peptidase [Bacteroidales bacterium]